MTVTKSQKLRLVVGRIRKALDDCRIELIAASRELSEFETDDEEKTPVRPKSQTALEAFRSSTDFSEKADRALKKS